MLTRVRRLRAAVRDERGFTLVELLVAVVILGVITLPIGNVVLGAIQHTDDSSRRLTESHDAQLSAAYLAQDVANLGTRDQLGDPLDPQLRQSVETGVGYNAGLYPCGIAGTGVAALRLASDDVVVGATGTATTTTVVVAYVVQPTAGSRYELHRLRCDGSTVPESTIVVARSLVAPPVVGCDASGSCTGAGPAVPRTIALRLRIQDERSTSTYEVTLSGQRRQE